MKKSDRRKFLKSITIGAGTITLSRFAQAAPEDALPSITSLLLDDDECQTALDGTILLNPVDSTNTEQSLCIPPDAGFMQITARGAGGAGSGLTSMVQQ